jgi:tRNA G18 (ribose-2'-O)-methylase SpoU
VATRDVLSRITGFEVTRGYLGVFRRPAPRAQEDVLRGARRLAVLEGIVDVSNVGAVFRSASALGIDGVLLAPGCADPYTRRALRTSMGCALRIPWARLGTPWPGSGIGLLHDHGFCCCALALRDDARPLDDPVLKEHERLALFLGTEGAGLSQKAIDACDERVVIPMSHGVDSLNVAAAASVAFWELRRRD